ncbi:MAG: hypothetical protein SF029_00880 [bacterium]|nr:hypothetical protein [bacterium]
MKRRLLLVLICAAFVLAACGGDNPSPSLSTPTADVQLPPDEPAGEETPESTEETTPEPTGEVIGLPPDEPVPTEAPGS